MSAKRRGVMSAQDIDLVITGMSTAILKNKRIKVLFDDKNARRLSENRHFFSNRTISKKQAQSYRRYRSLRLPASIVFSKITKSWVECILGQPLSGEVVIKS